MEMFDEKIKFILSKKLEIPASTEKVFYSTCANLNKTKRFKKYYKLKKMPFYIASLVLLSTGIVLATYFIKDYFHLTDSGINKAISENYIQINESNNDMNITNKYNQSIKCNAIIIDDYNISINLTLNFDEKNTNIADKQKILFNNLIIYDEENNIIFCNNKESFDLFCNQKSLNNKWTEYSSKYINSGINTISYKESENEFTIILNIYTQGFTFPKSKRLNIDIKEMGMRSNISEEIKDTIPCDLHFDIDIDEKFYNRTNTEYEIKTNPSKSLNISNVVVYNTCTKMNIDFYFEEGRKHYDDVEFMIKPFEEIYIENQAGEKFYLQEMSTENSLGSFDRETALYNYTPTFELTQFNATSKIFIHLKTRTENIIVELENKNNK